MSAVRHVAVADAARMIAEDRADVVDVRDALSYQAGHIPGARLLGNDNVRQFLAAADRSRPLIVCCYHGHSSVGAAAFLLEQGFAEVYSLDGGVEGWRFNHPLVTG